MENRIKDYSISGNSITLPRKTGIEDIRLIYNETQKILICSTAKKDNLSGVGAIVVNNFTNTTLINVPTNVCVLQPNDMLTIKCDYGDDLSSVESKVEEESVAIQSKIDNIDLSGVAKQGENIHATNTAIYESLKNSSGYIKMTNSEYDEFKAHIIEVTNNILN
jgi:hypothetical protein